MKICIISSSIFAVGQGDNPLPGYGGLEVIAWHCAKGLAAKGHRVTLIAPQGSSCPGCEVVACLPPGQGSEENAYGGARYKTPQGEEIIWPGYWPKLLEFNDDGVLIDHSWNKWAYLLKAEGRLTAPILGVCHAPINTMYGALPPGVTKPCFVCISEDQREHFEALHAPAQARVCYNGIDLDFYKPLAIQRSKRFLFLARFSTIKGPDLAIEACLKAGVGLDLIGDTSITNEPALFHHCQKMADGEQIRIVGSVPRGEAVWWLSQAYCLLHPNQRFREPFGLAPLEAMACGCPVIGWNYGAMKETIHQDHGWLVNSFDELVERIRLQQEIQPTFREECRKWAKGFSIQAMVDRYEKLCQEALEQPW